VEIIDKKILLKLRKKNLGNRLLVKTIDKLVHKLSMPIGKPRLTSKMIGPMQIGFIMMGFTFLTSAYTEL